MQVDNQPVAGAQTEPTPSPKGVVDVTVPKVAPQTKDANQALQVDTTLQPDTKINNTVYPHTFHMLPLHRVNNLLQQAVDTVLQTKVKDAKTKQEALKHLSQNWPGSSSSNEKEDLVQNVTKIAPYKNHDMKDNNTDLLTGMAKLGSDNPVTAEQLRQSLDFTSWAALRGGAPTNKMSDEEFDKFLSTERYNIPKFAATVLSPANGGMVCVPPSLFTELVNQSRTLERLAGGVINGTHTQNEAQQVAQVILGLQAISESGPLDVKTDVFEQATSMFKEIWLPTTGNVHETQEQIVEKNGELMALLQKMTTEGFLLKPHPSMSTRKKSKPKARLSLVEDKDYDPCKLPDFTVCNHENLNQLRVILRKLVISHASTRVRNATLTSVCTKLQLRIAELEQMLQSSHHNVAEIARQQHRSSQMASDYAAMMNMQTRSIQNLTIAYTQLQERFQLLPLIQRQCLDDIPQDQVYELLRQRKNLRTVKNNRGELENVWENLPGHSPDIATKTQEYLASKVQDTLYRQDVLLTKNHLAGSALDDLLQRDTNNKVDLCKNVSDDLPMLEEHRANHLSVALGAALRLRASQERSPIMAMQPNLVDALGLHIATGNEGSIAAMADLDTAYDANNMGLTVPKRQAIDVANLSRLTPQLSKQVAKSLPDMRAEVEMLSHLQLPFDIKDDSTHLNKVIAEVLSRSIVDSHNRKRKETPAGTSPDVARKKMVTQKPSIIPTRVPKKETFAAVAKRTGKVGIRNNPNQPNRDTPNPGAPTTNVVDNSRVLSVKGKDRYNVHPLPKHIGAYENKIPTRSNPNRTGPFVIRKAPDLTSFDSDAQAASGELRAILKVIRDVMITSASQSPFRVEGEKYNYYVCSPRTGTCDIAAMSAPQATYYMFKNIETFVAPKDAAGLLASVPRPQSLLNLRYMTSSDSVDNAPPTGAVANFDFGAQQNDDNKDLGDLPPWRNTEYSIIIKQTDEGVEPPSGPKITVEVNPMKIGDAFPDYTGKPRHVARIALQVGKVRRTAYNDYKILRSSLLGLPSAIREELQKVYSHKQWTEQGTDYGLMPCVMFAHLLLASKYLPDCPYDVASHMTRLAECCSPTAKATQHWSDSFNSVLWKPQEIGNDGTIMEVCSSTTFPISALLDFPPGKTMGAKQAAVEHMAHWGIGCNDNGEFEPRLLTTAISVVTQLMKEVEERQMLTPHQVYYLVGRGYVLVLNALKRGLAHQKHQMTKAQTDDGSAGREDTAGIQVAVEPAQ